MPVRRNPLRILLFREDLEFSDGSVEDHRASLIDQARTASGRTDCLEDDLAIPTHVDLVFSNRDGDHLIAHLRFVNLPIDLGHFVLQRTDVRSARIPSLLESCDPVLRPLGDQLVDHGEPPQLLRILHVDPLPGSGNGRDSEAEYQQCP